jgi:hypothetical protein
MAFLLLFNWAFLFALLVAAYRIARIYSAWGDAILIASALLLMIAGVGNLVLGERRGNPARPI